MMTDRIDSNAFATKLARLIEDNFEDQNRDFQYQIAVDVSKDGEVWESTTRNIGAERCEWHADIYLIEFKITAGPGHTESNDFELSAYGDARHHELTATVLDSAPGHVVAIRLAVETAVSSMATYDELLDVHGFLRGWDLT
jgi:hypothetical protein